MVTWRTVHPPVSRGAALLIGTLVGCSSPAAPSYYPATATLYGVVLDESGRPRSGMSIGAEVWSHGCTARVSRPSSFVRPVTDAAGRYSLLMQSATAGTRCVRLVTPAGANRDSIIAELPAVDFRVSNRDSVRVDLRVR